MNIRFQTKDQYLFVHRNVKHLLLVWEKDHRKQLYIVEEEDSTTLTLRDPGETYSEQILDELEPVFFQQLETEIGPIATLLGATFPFRNRLIGMYYNPYRPTEDVYFLELLDREVIDLSDEDYPLVVSTFQKEFPEYCSTS